MQLVQDYALLTHTPADWIAAGASVALVMLGAFYLIRARGSDPTQYRPDLAWLRAFIYFSLALLASWSLGVLQALLTMPLVEPQQWQDAVWIAVTLVYVLVLVIGYGVLWPRGTYTDERLSHPLLTSAYGLFWGLCHGQVFLCFWAVAELSGLNSYWVAAITYLLLSGYNFAFHQFFWDIKVSPPHNYAAWNLKKVQYCHAPNLLIGLTWLALWGNFSLWLLLQTACLVASAHSMRFPAWYDSYRGVAGATR